METHVTQRQRELEDLQKNLTGDSSLLKELLDHLAEADNDNLLLLQYSAEDASKIKVLMNVCDLYCILFFHMLMTPLHINLSYIVKLSTIIQCLQFLITQNCLFFTPLLPILLVK